MNLDDPFGWIVQECQMSFSEESRLNGGSYFVMSDSDDFSSDSSGLNPPDIPVAVAGITMVSPPESAEEEVPHDRSTSLHEDREIFHTPPESRSNSTSTSFENCLDDRINGCGFDSEGGNGTVDADGADSRRAVDLGRDTDLRFSEVEVDLSQMVQSNLNPDEMVRRESEEIRVSKRGFSPVEKLSTESPSKRLKSLDFELPTEPLERDTDLGFLEVGVDFSQRIQSNLNPDDDMVRRESEEIRVSKGGVSPDEPLSTESLSKRLKSLDSELPTEPLGTPKELISSDQVRDSGEKGSNPCVMEKKSEGKRTLPSWANIVRIKERTIESGQVRDSGEKGSKPCGIEKKSEGERALPSCVNIGRVGDDKSDDEELENNETELSSSSNGRAEEDNERADEELENNEMELPSSSGRVGSNEKADEELNVNERETIHLDTNPDNLNENVEKIPLWDVLKKLAEDLEEDSSLECLNVLEVAQNKCNFFR